MNQSEIYSALDLHANTCVLGSMDKDGKMLASKRFSTSKSQLIGHVRSVQAKRHYLVVEQSNQAHWVACVLQPYVDKLVICDPKVNKQVYDGVVKSDVMDVRTLCELFRLNAIKPVYYGKELGPRKLFFGQIKEYERITKMLVSNKNQFQAILRNWGCPIKMNKSMYGHPEQVLEQIERRDLQTELRAKLELIGYLQQVKERQKRAFIETGRSFWEIQEFKKMPGCGDVYAHTFSAYLQTPHRFSDWRQVVHFCKLAVRHHSSDRRNTRPQMLAKSGHSSLKHATHQIWKAAMRRNDDNEIKQFFRASLERTGGNEEHARLNCQRKIVKSFWSLWKNNQSYQPDKFLGSTNSPAVCT